MRNRALGSLGEWTAAWKLTVLTVQGRLSTTLPRRRFMDGERDVEGVAAGVAVRSPEVNSGEYASIVGVVVEEDGGGEGKV